MLPRVDCWIGGSFGTKLCFCPILERERENAKLPSLLTRLKKNSEWGFSLKVFHWTDSLLAPLTSKAVSKLVK